MSVQFFIHRINTKSSLAIPPKVIPSLEQFLLSSDASLLSILACLFPNEILLLLGNFQRYKEELLRRSLDSRFLLCVTGTHNCGAFESAYVRVWIDETHSFPYLTSSMNVLGSVFLGDAVRHRAYSPTIGSPPTSPVPAPVPGPKTTSSSRAPAIDPELSLELRIRWLECLLHGVRQESRRAKGGKNSGADERDESRKGEVLVLKAEEVQRKLDRTVQGNDGLRKFMDRCERLSLS